MLGTLVSNSKYNDAKIHIQRVQSHIQIYIQNGDNLLRMIFNNKYNNNGKCIYGQHILALKFTHGMQMNYCEVIINVIIVIRHNKCIYRGHYLTRKFICGMQMNYCEVASSNSEISKVYGNLLYGERGKPAMYCTYLVILALLMRHMQCERADNMSF